MVLDKIAVAHAGGPSRLIGRDAIADGTNRGSARIAGFVLLRPGTLIHGQGITAGADRVALGGRGRAASPKTTDILPVEPTTAIAIGSIARSRPQASRDP